ncbi:hypothetical protein K4K49_001605 [Colletotrichum sp. SAR 10_70]|nr:hypothetical protein K4K50_004029 [Colletotrichum sp. SAR 10_71]KAI8173492.1 hypothetical protein KHU50_004618 [Colletotrichum sp. SAR 10_65]KAI8179851.1 hypothetical protein K4K49_001605 [Colletotrichum sp. SAR 10_70]KAI8239489.1 hypothetical protein K4K53_004253 [Colletotrichum sp. SAR 10_77]
MSDTAEFYPCRGLEPLNATSDPDISGIGVMVGFLGTGCLMVAMLFCHYILVYDPELDPLRKTDEPEMWARRPNAVDVAILKRLRKCLELLICSCIGIDYPVSGRPVRPGPNGERSIRERLVRQLPWLKDSREATRIQASFNKCLLAMSDIQIATGLAVLISAYHGLSDDLSGKHWLMITYTA